MARSKKDGRHGAAHRSGWLPCYLTWGYHSSRAAKSKEAKRDAFGKRLTHRAERRASKREILAQLADAA